MTCRTQQPDGRTTQVSMRMPTHVKAKIDALALETGWTNSYLMTELIRGSLEMLNRDMMPPSLGRILWEIEEKEKHKEELS